MANSGVDVTGVDVNEANVERINRGEVTIVEPDLEDELKQAIESGNFRATTTQVHAQTYIIAVPTPFTDSYDVDMKYIYSAADAIAPKLEGDELIVLESTSPPLTTQKMADKILELRPDLAADGAENPDKTSGLLRTLPGKNPSWQSNGRASNQRPHYRWSDLRSHQTRDRHLRDILQG